MVSFFERVKYLFSGNSEDLQQETNRQIQEALRAKEQTQRKAAQEAERKRKERFDNISWEIGGTLSKKPSVFEVKDMLKRNPDFNIDNVYEFPDADFPNGFSYGTALTGASQFQNHEVVEFLLERGADPSIRDSFNKDATAWAIERMDSKLLEILLADPRSNLTATNSPSHVQLDYRDLYTTPLTKAIMDVPKDSQARVENDQKILSVLDVIKKDGRFHLNGQDSMGRTALHWAIERGRAEVFESLIEVQGCDINIRDENGITPLCMALSEGEEEMAIKLIEAGALFTPDSHKNTPLYMSVGQPRALEALVRVGADVNQPSGAAGIMPIEWAVRKGDVESVKLLLENGADTACLYQRNGQEYLSSLDLVKRDLPRDNIPQNYQEIFDLLEAHEQAKNNKQINLNHSLSLNGENISQKSEEINLSVQHDYSSTIG